MKIMLVCAAGASSTIMASAIKKAAAAQGNNNVKVIAFPEYEFEGYLEDGFDVVLFGPHLKNQEKKLQGICDDYDIPGACISTEAYGNLDGAKGYAEALALIK